LASGFGVLACVVAGFLLIARPWGPHTVVAVLLVGGGGAIMVLALAGVTAQAIMDIRGSRKH
jgi:hypothetical protein